MNPFDDNTLWNNCVSTNILSNLPYDLVCKISEYVPELILEKKQEFKAGLYKVIPQVIGKGIGKTLQYVESKETDKMIIMYYNSFHTFHIKKTNFKGHRNIFYHIPTKSNFYWIDKFTDKLIFYNDINIILPWIDYYKHNTDESFCQIGFIDKLIGEN